MYIFPEFDTVLMRHVRNPDILRTILLYAEVPKVTPKYVLRSMGKIHKYVCDRELSSRDLINIEDLLLYFSNNWLNRIDGFESDVSEAGETLQFKTMREYHQDVTDIWESEISRSTDILRHWSIYVYTLGVEIEGQSDKDKLQLLKEIFRHTVEYIFTWNIYFGGENLILHRYKDLKDSFVLTDELSDLQELVDTYAAYMVNPSFSNRFPAQREIYYFKDLLKRYGKTYFTVDKDMTPPLVVWSTQSDGNEFLGDIRWSPFFRSTASKVVSLFFTSGIPTETLISCYTNIVFAVGPEIKRLKVLKDPDALLYFKSFMETMKRYFFEHIVYLSVAQTRYEFITGGHAVTYH